MCSIILFWLDSVSEWLSGFHVEEKNKADQSLDWSSDCGVRLTEHTKLS